MKVTLSLVALASAAILSQAQTAAPVAKPPPLSAYDKWEEDAKHPCDWLTWGADLRIRNEYFDNVLTTTKADRLHETDVIRYRGRVWASANLVTNLSLNARLAAEPRQWLDSPGFGPLKGKSSGMEWRYGMLDNANLKWNNMFDQPLSLTAGRQDITFGDYWNWWLVADGTPQDGSWTYFLDAIRLTFDAKDIKTKFDVIYIYQNAQPGAWIPTFDNSSEYMLTAQREQGVVLYASNKSIKNTTLDAFFIYKNDLRQTFTIAGKTSAPGDNADIYTLGGRITGLYGNHWQPSLEGAYQFGHKEDKRLGVNANSDIDAFGLNARLAYLCKDPLNNQFQLMYEYLSGDNPKTTGKDEMFDLLWGCWPRWSELYIYSYGIETSGKIAQVNNIQRVGGGWSFDPAKDLSFSVVYNALFAPESVPTRALKPSVFSGSGNFRGHYLQTALKYKFNKHISAHLWAEFIWEGDYYAQRDTMIFLRPEIMFTF